MIKKILFAVLLAFALVAYKNYFFMPQELKWVLMSVMAVSLLLFNAVKIFAGFRSTNGASTIAIDAVDIGLLAFTAYAALSLSWSPDPRNGAVFMVGWLMLWVIFSEIKNAPATENHQWILIAVSLTLPFVLMHQIVDPKRWSGFFNENFVTEYVILTIPFVVGTLWIFRKVGITYLVGVILLCWMLFYLVLQNPSKIEFFSVPILVGLFGTVYLWRKSRPTALGLILAVITLFVTAMYFKWAHHNGFGESILPRLVFIFNTMVMWVQHPIQGNGLGSFTYLYPAFQTSYLEYFHEIDFMRNKVELAGAAHNDYVQFLSDFGLLGVAIVLPTIWMVVRAYGKTSLADWSVSVWVGMAGLVLLLANAFIEFPFQNPSTALMAALIFGFVVHGARMPVLYQVQTRVLASAIAILYIVLAGFLSVTAVRRAQAQQEYFLMAITQRAPDVSFAHMQLANQFNPWDFQMRVQLYQSLAQWNRALGRPPLPPQEYDKVFATSLTTGPQVLVLLNHLEYLLYTDRYKENIAELESTLVWLKNYFPNNPDVWINDSYYNMLMGRAEPCIRALAIAKKLETSEEQDKKIEILENGIAKLSHPNP
jgi:hypothetical protein